MRRVVYLNSKRVEPIILTVGRFVVYRGAELALRADNGRVSPESRADDVGYGRGVVRLVESYSSAAAGRFAPFGRRIAAIP